MPCTFLGKGLLWFNFMPSPAGNFGSFNAFIGSLGSYDFFFDIGTVLSDRLASDYFSFGLRHASRGVRILDGKNFELQFYRRMGCNDDWINSLLVWPRHR